MELKQTTAADAKEILDMGRAFHAEDGRALSPAGEAALVRTLDYSPYVTSWLIVDNGVTCGYCVLCFSYSVEFGGSTAFLDDLYIKPEHRAAGLGSQTLKALEKIARDDGCCALLLEVEDDKPRALAFHLQNSYVDMQRTLMVKDFMGYFSEKK
jgi:GNAT superfamily N-acetyltransferase